MTTSERLQRYEVFDPEVIEAVSAVAEEQAPYSFQELADRYGVGSGPQQSQPFEDGRVLGYYELTHGGRSQKQDERLVYHTPMAIPADKSMAARAFRLAALLPETPIVVAGNPSLLGMRENRLRAEDRAWIGVDDFTPLVSPVLKHLSNKEVSRAQFVGFSFGADLAAASALTASHAAYNIEASRGIWMEPGGIAKRSLVNLLKDFKSAEPQLTHYVDAVEGTMLSEARDPGNGLRSTVDFVRYVGGLARPTNIAIARSLARGSFGKRAIEAVTLQPTMKSTLAWGSASELVPSEVARQLAESMSGYVAPRRFTSLEIPGMHHAGGDDIDLHAAIVLQAMRDQDKLPD